MANQLRKAALAKYKQDKLTSWVVGILTSLFIAAILFVGVFVSGLSIITVPLVILPFFFAMVMNHIGLRYNNQITLKGHLNFTFGYFRYPFSGCFRVMITFLKSIIVYAATSLFFSMIISILSSLTNIGNGDAVANQLINLIYSSETTEEQIIEMFNLDGSFTSIYLLLIYLIPLTLSVLYFIYRVFYESISIYIRVALAKANPSFLRSAVAECYRSNKKTLKRDFWNLNFPLAILMLLGLLIGFICCYFFISNSMLIILPFGFASAFLLSMFFMPFFYINLDVIYDKYEDTFRNNSVSAIKNILHRIQLNIDLTQEERKEVESSLSEMLQEDDKEKDP